MPAFSAQMGVNKSSGDGLVRSSTISKAEFVAAYLVESPGICL